MAKIKKLNPQIIAAIAAGEVAERPSLIVKELVENSIDAHAFKININLKKSGLEQVIIQDDGHAMSEDDLKICYLRHSTSKINKLLDLANINSLGFRGEALASIAGVSQLVIKSKPKNQTGFKIKILNNNPEDLEPVGMSDGTVVVVKDLFNNLPARKKFLNNSQAEFRKILNIFYSFALAYPEISFNLTNNNKHIYTLPKGNLENRIKILFKNNYFDNLININFINNNFKLSGFIAKPQLARKSNIDQYFFVNQRLIKSTQISKLIKKAYANLIDPNFYPAFILNLNLPSSETDVNIHPQKISINFKNQKNIFKFIYQNIKNILNNKNLIYQYQDLKQQDLIFKDASADKYLYQSLKNKKFNLNNLQNNILQVNLKYLIYQKNNKLIIVDQHAAQEKILFEKYKNKFDKQKIKIKKLTKKTKLNLNLADKNLLKNNINLFNNLNFEFEIENSIYLTKIPEILQKQDLNKIILEILDDLRDFEIVDINQKSLQTLEFLACRNAIKAGDELNEKQRFDLIKNLEKSKNIYTCPHGRPAQVEINFKDLDKMFKRR